jgi:hypothetical protein
MAVDQTAERKFVVTPKTSTDRRACQSRSSDRPGTMLSSAAGLVNPTPIPSEQTQEPNYFWRARRCRPKRASRLDGTDDKALIFARQERHPIRCAASCLDGKAARSRSHVKKCSESEATALGRYDSPALTTATRRSALRSTGAVEGLCSFSSKREPHSCCTMPQARCVLLLSGC